MSWMRNHEAKSQYHMVHNHMSRNIRPSGVGSVASGTSKKGRGVIWEPEKSKSNTIQTSYLLEASYFVSFCTKQYIKAVLNLFNCCVFLVYYQTDSASRKNIRYCRVHLCSKRDCRYASSGPAVYAVHVTSTPARRLTESIMVYYLRGWSGEGYLDTLWEYWPTGTQVNSCASGGRIHL